MGTTIVGPQYTTVCLYNSNEGIPTLNQKKPKWIEINESQTIKAVEINDLFSRRLLIDDNIK